MSLENSHGEGSCHHKARIGQYRRSGTLLHKIHTHVVAQPCLLFAKGSNDVGGARRVRESTNHVQDSHVALWFNGDGTPVHGRGILALTLACRPPQPSTLRVREYDDRPDRFCGRGTPLAAIVWSTVAPRRTLC